MDPWTLGVLALLLCGSALFSSSETALFSLSENQRKDAGPIVDRLLHEPRELLIAVLFGNLLVNLFFFASVGRLAEGTGSNLLVGFGALIMILIFGEILPKTLGLTASVTIARFTAPLLTVLVTLTTPVRLAMSYLLEVAGRLIGFEPDEQHLRPEDLERLFDKIADGGHMLYAEADLLAEIVGLSSINVRQIMTPRVDALFLELDGSNRDEVTESAIEKRLARLPVIDQTADRVVGQVRVRDLLVNPDRGIPSLMRPVPFVPEVASSVDLLHCLRHLRAAEAVVVDEWGGTAGVVTLEDIFEEIVGDLRVEGEAREVPVVPLGEGRFRVAGSLSMHDWNDDFGFDVVPKEFETVGGFVTALLGRIPRSGDVAHWGRLVLEAQEVRGRRVQWVVMSVAADDGTRLEVAPAMGGRGFRRSEDGRP
ncbi:MAG: hemolysin family protein [Planctomycetota bacterium]|nr:hemolysin family protein [Planctomycetota bacterium]